jgi:hypothetical protein
MIGIYTTKLVVHVVAVYGVNSVTEASSFVGLFSFVGRLGNPFQAGSLLVAFVLALLVVLHSCKVSLS